MARKARQTTPGASYGFTDEAGRTRELVADAEGRIVPSDHDEEKILDAYHLPVVASAAKKKASEAPKEEEAEPGG